MQKLFIALFILAITFQCNASEVKMSKENVYKNQPGPYTVKSVLYDWNDTQRERKIPVKIYYPESESQKFPVIIFSHGLGGSRQGYTYLGNHWASHGYICIHLQHLGSDDSVWLNKSPAEIMPAMRKAVADLNNSLNRIYDVHFTLDKIEFLNKEDGLFKGKFDLEHIGMAGHSFGAFTTLAVIGEGYPRWDGSYHRFDDSRIKAAISMSATPSRHREKLKQVYSGIDIPCFHMTGTLDDSLVADTKASERRLIYDNIDRADNYLLTFEGGDHMVFAGRDVPGRDGSKDPVFHLLIQMSTTAFWDAYLRADQTALQWLTAGQFKQVLGENGVFEQKSE